MIKKLLPCLLLTLSLPLQAEWVLNNKQSHLSFISIKQGHLAETHGFTALSGHIDDNGQATLIIDLDSVATEIPLRDERMRDMLFETEEYGSDASFTTQIDAKKLAALGTGESEQTDVQGQLNLHGQTKPMNASLLVTRVNETTLQVFTQEPININAADFNLIEGVDALREIVLLDQISLAVPVTFVLIFNQATQGKGDDN